MFKTIPPCPISIYSYKNSLASVSIWWRNRGSHFLVPVKLPQTQIMPLRIKTLDYLNVRSWLPGMHTSISSVRVSLTYIMFAVDVWQLHPPLPESPLILGEVCSAITDFPAELESNCKLNCAISKAFSSVNIIKKQTTRLTSSYSQPWVFASSSTTNWKLLAF